MFVPKSGSCPKTVATIGEKDKQQKCKPRRPLRPQRNMTFKTEPRRPLRPQRNMTFKTEPRRPLRPRRKMALKLNHEDRKDREENQEKCVPRFLQNRTATGETIWTPGLKRRGDSGNVEGNHETGKSPIHLQRLPPAPRGQALRNPRWRPLRGRRSQHKTPASIQRAVRRSA